MVPPPSREAAQRLQDERQQCLFTAQGPWYLYFNGAEAAEPTKKVSLSGLRRRLADENEPEDALA